MLDYLSFFIKTIKIEEFFLKHALKDLNPRHQVLETYVLPTELRALSLKLKGTIKTSFYQIKYLSYNLRRDFVLI